MRKLYLAVLLFCGLALAAAPADAGVVRHGARAVKAVAKASAKVVKVAAKVAYKVAY